MKHAIDLLKNHIAAGETDTQSLVDDITRHREALDKAEAKLVQHNACIEHAKSALAVLTSPKVEESPKAEEPEAEAPKVEAKPEAKSDAK